MSRGKVYLIGAGPGDPDLITVKGLECLREADVVVYDRLVHPALLSHARAEVELIYVGKQPGAHAMKQEDINRLLVRKALEGKKVVRLKGGDPFVLGRGGEEAEFLAREGVPYEVVPGVTSAIAVPAYAGIPVTHRGVSKSFCVIAGHEEPEDNLEYGKTKISDVAMSQGEVAGKPVIGDQTLVFLMGMQNLSTVVHNLMASGWDAATPVAVIRWGTLPKQETLVGTLETICTDVERKGFTPPAVVVVGNVVRLREKIRWYDNQPLFGKRVLVTRSREQASTLSGLLRRQGAEPIEVPVIKIVPPPNFDELDQALGEVGNYDWILFTSANAVHAVIKRLAELGMDVRSLKGPKIGAIGPETAHQIRTYGIGVDFMPSEFVAEAVAREFPEDPTGRYILIPRARQAREALPEALAQRGAHVRTVAAYETLLDDSEARRVKELLDSGGIDIITFTSSSTVRNFTKLAGTLLPSNIKIACIGPVTAQTARECGLEPDIVADTYTIEGLVEKLVEVYRVPSAD